MELIIMGFAIVGIIVSIFTIGSISLLYAGMAVDFCRDVKKWKITQAMNKTLKVLLIKQHEDITFDGSITIEKDSHHHKEIMKAIGINSRKHTIESEGE